MFTTDVVKPVADHRRVNDFFDVEYAWWQEVYAPTLPRRFFSFEMIKRRELVVRLLHKYMTAGAQPRILECGCGPGGILGEVATRPCRLTGIDINPRHLARARSDVGENVAWIQADVEKLPFRDQAFDIVCCIGVLSYLQTDEAAVAEIARVVRKGGVVIMALPNWLMLDKIFDPYYYLVWLPSRALRHVFPAFAAASPGNRFNTAMIRRYRPARITTVFSRHGLTEVESCNVSFGPMTLWRREVFPLGFSIRISEALSALGRRGGFSFLRGVTNHWISCLAKTGS